MMHAIYAILKTTLKCAWSTRATIWLLVSSTLPALFAPFLLQADGTTEGARTMILTYTPVLIFGILLTGTIWLSAYALAAERIQPSFAMLRTKPVSGATIWIAKWLAVLTILVTALMIAGITFILSLEARFRGESMANSPVWTAFRPDESHIILQAQQHLDRLREETPPDEAHHLPSLQQIANRLRQQNYRVAPGTGTSWHVPIAADTDHHPMDMLFSWRLDPMRRAPVSGVWTLTFPGKTEPLAIQNVAGLLDGNHTTSWSRLEIPPEATYLEVRFTASADNEPMIFFDVKNPITLRQFAGTLRTNLIRTAGIMIILCAAATALTLAMSAFLSFPVTVFASHGIMAALLIATVAGHDSIISQHTHGHAHCNTESWLAHQTGHFLDIVYRASHTLRAAMPFRRLAEDIRVTFPENTWTLIALSILLPALCAALAHYKIMRDEVV